MIRLRHKLLIQGFRVSDQLILASCLAGAVELWPRITEIGPRVDLFNQVYRMKDGIGIALIGLGWGLIFHLLIRTPGRLKGIASQLLDLLKATSVAAFWLLVISALFSFSRITPLVIILFWATSFAFGALSRIAIQRFLVMIRKSGYNYRFLLIVGCNRGAQTLAAKIESSPELGYKIVGFVDERSAGQSDQGDWPNAERWKIVGSLRDIKAIFERGTVDEVLIGLPVLENFAVIAEIIRLGQELGIVVRLMPEPEHVKVLKKLHIELFDGDYVVTLFREQLLVQLMLKRLTDIAVSASLLSILSPLLLSVALAIKLTSPGPVFFVQERMGMNKRRFKLYKFRSMVVDAEKRINEVTHLNEMDGPVFKIKRDPRVTSIGRLIRKTSIDELPQLINVLRGQMSLVGPRPPLPAEVERYDWLYQKRLSMKPGITCLWQVNGRNQISFKQWMELDREYIENWSLWLDYKVLVKTIPVVFTGRGAS